MKSRKFREQRHYDLADHIIIKDWAGNILYQGHYGTGEVDRVLAANRCKHCRRNKNEFCLKCDDTGYSGDFSFSWLDEKDGRNVYEYINY